jgi:V/A-type H+-transporting ATPase subunit I
MSASKQALKIYSHTSLPESMLSSLEGRKIMTVQEYEEKSEKVEDVYNIVESITDLTKKISETKTSAANAKNQAAALEPWLNLDIPMDSADTKNTAVYIGTLPGDFPIENIYAKIAQENSALDSFDIEVLNSCRDQTCLFAVCAKDQAQKFEECLRGMGYSVPSFLYHETPRRAQEKLLGQAQSYQELIDAYEAQIKDRASSKENIRFLIDYFAMKMEKNEAANNLIQSANTFYMEGYVPKCAAAQLEQALDEKYKVALAFEDVKDENTPVILKNNNFALGVESVVESYSLPNDKEFDPSSVMSFFYYIFFGLMLGDFVYGLIMFGVSFFLLMKFKDMEKGSKKFFTMFMYCGLSTMFWGVMFGSYMGDIVNVVSKNWFGHEVGIPALWFVPLNDPMRMLVYSLGFGLVHMFIGLGMLGYTDIKNKQYTDFIYDVVFWYGLLIGLILMLLNSEMFQSMANMVFTFSPAVMFIAKWAVILCAVGIILTSGRESRGFKRILKGLYGLYGVSGWLSDVLSYSRLLALGLATGVIASVINQMGAMIGTGVIGTVLFIVVIIVGHSLNIGINVLGAYVHTNRLQFVEFFSKFYNGGGKKFKPFAADTTYYKFKEEIK